MPECGRDTKEELILGGTGCFIPSLLHLGLDLHHIWLLLKAFPAISLFPRRCFPGKILVHLISSWCLLLRGPRLTPSPISVKRYYRVKLGRKERMFTMTLMMTIFEYCWILKFRKIKISCNWELASQNFFLTAVYCLFICKSAFRSVYM